MVANFLDPEGVFSAPALLAGLGIFGIYNLHTLKMLGFFKHIYCNMYKLVFYLFFPMYRVVYPQFIWYCSRETLFTSSWGGGRLSPLGPENFVCFSEKKEINSERISTSSVLRNHSWLSRYRRWVFIIR